MSGNRRVAVLVLVLFTWQPVSGTLCATMCDSAAPSASAEPDKHCEEVGRASTGVQIERASEHDCSNHDAAIRQDASPVSQRLEPKAAAMVFALSGHGAFGSFGSAPRSAPALDDTSPPGTAQRTTTPLVLRV